MTNCKRCGRKLSSAISVARRMGDRCAKLDAFERALADFKPAQLQAAIELIDDGAIQPSLTRPHVFAVVKSDGTGLYLTTRNVCNCPAGLKSRRCYHIAAVIAVEAA